MLVPHYEEDPLKVGYLPQVQPHRESRIETLCEAGFGGEARVFLQLRNVFPGPGGTVVTEQDIATAFRVPNGVDADSLLTSRNLGFPPESDLNSTSFRVFLKHVIIKKLDDFFFRSGKYGYAHIPRPLGCTTDGAYLYEWVFGIEGAPIDYIDDDLRKIPLSLGEESTVFGAFEQFGINLSHDTSEPERAWRKNLIVEESGLGALPKQISCLWKRIDFGGSSIGFNAELLETRFQERQTELVHHLGCDRVEMMRLAAQFFQNRSVEIDRLFELLGDYRLRTARHMGAEAISPIDRKYSPDVLVLDPEDELVHEAPTVIRTKRLNAESELNYEIRREFPGIDGTIFTHQHLAVARITRQVESEYDSGFKLFLRHFLLKKLENAFISMGRYNFPHISRPLGSEERSYVYEWVEGEALCPQECILGHENNNRENPGCENEKVPLLKDWEDFVASFRMAGVEMEKNLRWIPHSPTSDKFVAKQIIVRHSQVSSNLDVNSRLWARVNCHEKSIPIDYDRLKKYLFSNMDTLLEHLTAGRFETMVRAVNYLTGTLGSSGIDELRNGIQAYRRSALKHLNYRGFSR